MYRFPRLVGALAGLICLCATPVLSATPLPTSDLSSAGPESATVFSVSAVLHSTDKGTTVDPDG